MKSIKQLLLIIFTLISMQACATKQAVVTEKAAAEKPISGSVERTAPLFGSLLSDVKISSVSFNPTRGDDVGIVYTLSVDAKVTVNVYDADYGLIDVLAEDEKQNVGQVVLRWDGKDIEGDIVPNEAYFFTIEAKDKDIEEIYDPVTFSGGIEQTIKDAKVYRESNTIVYKLPQSVRVLIRAGIWGGPMVKSVVDWKPRIAGEITEHWDGRDHNSIMDVRDNRQMKLAAGYFTLPDNSMITYGNKDIDFREYKNTLAQGRPEKVERKRIKVNGKLSRHFKQKRVNDYAPEVAMKFFQKNKEITGDIPGISGKTLVKVFFDEINEYFSDQQYEVVFYLDGDFHAEEETGSSPFNWVWNPVGVKEGEHVVTVNFTGFKGQIGVVSKKVKIIK